MTKITIFYADDIMNAFQKERRSTFNGAFDCQDSFYNIPLCSRIEWVKEQCKIALNRKKPTIFVTNDYNYMKLLQEFAGNEFSIYNVDTGEIVYDFVDLKPNYALKIAHHIFVWSARVALTKGK